MLINQIRPEWTEAVNQAWLNWRFLLAFVAPVAVSLIAMRCRYPIWYFAPFTMFLCWFFMSAGVYNISEVMANVAVTNEEMTLAASDTGRTFAPLVLIPIWAFAYTLILTFAFREKASLRTNQRGRSSLIER